MEAGLFSIHQLDRLGQTEIACRLMILTSEMLIPAEGASSPARKREREV
jgi:hypothetical protein